MNSDTLVILMLGMCSGGALGYVTAWRMARKLEAHGVRLSHWDKPFDMQAPEVVAKFPAQVSR
jgi:hypothetical protein